MKPIFDEILNYKVFKFLWVVQVAKLFYLKHLSQCNTGTVSIPSINSSSIEIWIAPVPTSARQLIPHRQYHLRLGSQLSWVLLRPFIGYLRPVWSKMARTGRKLSLCQPSLAPQNLFLFHAGEASSQCHAPNHCCAASSPTVWSPRPHLFISSAALSWSLPGTWGSRWARAAMSLAFPSPCLSDLAAYHGLVLGSHLACLWG